ncbi:amino acid ABC transporter substrate-binding protein [Thalassospira mesophila]|uniref:Amino acid ABC transporter substrate-binding protein n=1 Tax=Thalassospira mesophila TaxID=1293891 RepID=A0A1Y2L3V2_9PROT|nr:amino acid ABC transporter substrate-binding protein [Thalassospira mesophila]
MPGPLLARPLIIEGLSEAPLKWQDGANIRGIDIDIMKAVLAEMQISEFEFRLVPSGNRLLYNARSGASDIVLSLSQSPERKEFLDYPEEAHLLLDWRFAIRKADHDRISFNEFSDLAGLHIGAAASFSYTPAFWESGLDIETVAKNNLLIPMLLRRRFDIVPLNYMTSLYEARQAGVADELLFLYPPIRQAAYYNVWSKASRYRGKQAFQKRYDAIIRKMQQDGSIAAIIESYLGPQNDPKQRYSQ